MRVRQHHQRLRVDPGTLADLLCALRMLVLGLFLLVQVQVQGGETVIAREDQLRLSGLCSASAIASE